MNANEFLITSSIVLALVLYIPLISGILRGTINQSFATWILWASLDLIALVSVILQKGNYALLACYVFGGLTIAFVILCKKPLMWTRFETLVFFMVAICLVVWKMSGPRGATIASTIAVCISGLPQIRDSWREPDRKTAWIYSGYVLANGLSFFGGKAWTIEDTFYPGMMAVLCIVVAVAASRKIDSRKIAVHIRKMAL